MCNIRVSVIVMSQRLSSYMLNALDFATITVLKSMAMNEWKNVPVHMLLLAYTSGDTDINDYVEKEIDKISKEQKYVNSATGYTYAQHALNICRSEQQILMQHSLKMFKEVRLMQRRKGYLSANGQISRKEFEDLNKETSSTEEGF